MERPQKKAASHTEEELSRYKEKVAELERKLQVAISHMEEQSSRIEEQSSQIEEQSSCLKRLHLQVDELSARNELNVSTRMQSCSKWRLSVMLLDSILYPADKDLYNARSVFIWFSVWSVL